MAIHEKNLQSQLHEAKCIEGRADSSSDLFQVLTPGGELLRSIDERIAPSLRVRMYEWMTLVRAFDRKSVNLQRQGRMGTYAPFEGQEAAQVGSALALRASDWLFPTYRDHAAAIVHGQDMFRVFLYWKGHVDGSICPAGKRIMPPYVPIATQMVHAVGTAWASKLKKESDVSLVYFGDGATSEGDFHEALNFAGVLQTPTVFVCENNGYAISVPFDKQSSSRTIAQRAAAYDIPGVRVDGNDIFAIYLAVCEAVERGRRGDGPTLIEAVTFRYGAHTTSDDPRKYREQDALANLWRETRDPLLRLQKFLKNSGLWSDEEEARLNREVAAQIDAQLVAAEEYPIATPSDMFNHVYSEMPWHLNEQRHEFKQSNQKVVNES